MRDFQERKEYTAWSKVLMYSQNLDNENLHNYAYQFASAAAHFAVVNIAAFDTKTKSDRCAWVVKHLTKLWEAWIRMAAGYWGGPQEVEVKVFMPPQTENAIGVYPNGDPVCMVTGRLEWGETFTIGSTLDYRNLPSITDMASWAEI